MGRLGRLDRVLRGRRDGMRRRMQWGAAGAALAIAVGVGLGSVAAADPSGDPSSDILSQRAQARLHAASDSHVQADSPGQVVNDLTSGVTAGDLANTLAGPGVTVSDATFTGNNQAGGTFSGFGPAVGFDSGIVLSSGKAADAVGPNTSDDNTTAFGTPGDADLTALAGFPTFDAASVQFQFVPQGDQVSFNYVFGSEEYNEFSNTEFNDVFAFFVNGNDLAHDCATVGGAPVSVNTINGGNPLGTDPKNPDLYRNNENGSTAGGDWSPGPIDVQADGLTVVLKCTASVNPGVPNTMKLAIADGSDDILDSWTWIQAGSLAVTSPTPPTPTPPVPVEAVVRFTG